MPRRYREEAHTPKSGHSCQPTAGQEDERVTTKASHIALQVRTLTHSHKIFRNVYNREESSLKRMKFHSEKSEEDLQGASDTGHLLSFAIPPQFLFDISWLEPKFLPLYTVLPVSVCFP